MTSSRSASDAADHAGRPASGGAQNLRALVPGSASKSSMTSTARPSCAGSSPIVAVVTGVASCANTRLSPPLPRDAATPSPPARNAPRRESRFSVIVFDRGLVMAPQLPCRDLPMQGPVIYSRFELSRAANCSQYYARVKSGRSVSSMSGRGAEIREFAPPVLEFGDAPAIDPPRQHRRRRRGQHEREPDRPQPSPEPPHRDPGDQHREPHRSKPQ